MRISLSAGFLLAAVAVSGFGIRTNAAPIASLNPGGNQSTVSAYASDDDAGTTVTNNVNSLPYSTPVTSTDGANSSTVTPTLTNSGLNFAFSQSILDVESPSQTSGTGDVFFTAGANTTFSIAGSMTLNGDFIEGNLVTSLYDVTTSTYLYNYNQYTYNSELVAQAVEPIGDSSTLTLDTSGGSLTGSLNAGDSYEFYAYQEMDNETDPGVTGNVGLTLSQVAPPVGGGSSAPLPSAATSGLATLLGLGIVLSRRRKIATA
jgi:hypothetical protein